MPAAPFKFTKFFAYDSQANEFIQLRGTGRSGRFLELAWTLTGRNLIEESKQMGHTDRFGWIMDHADDVMWYGDKPPQNHIERLI